ncbi:toxin [Candidatus Symbiopectobacterium sp. NZEC127]|uniref:toxin n=1 Tax=Candidatus Symbiopectobacterium sp. NZEC127 TaxID=2820472 RepID=UPI002227A38E|nr:toxin [Candidatus Symbiopectobacterium sp. NZEC127]MCW2487973.1 toxin [Candidatus Symbiopectobacterium sp. NZEC127]
MEAIFVELPVFEKYRAEYLTDEQFHQLQMMLLEDPLCGDVLKHTGGLRKIRFKDERRNKGKRGGLRVVYYWWSDEGVFYLFTLFDKDEMSDLTKPQLEMLSRVLEQIKKRTDK